MSAALVLSLIGAFASGPFEVEADELRATLSDGVYIAEGRAVLRRQGVVLYADRLTFDENRKLVVAEGHVVVVEGASVLSCRRVTMRVPELLGGVASAELRIKSGLAHEVLRDVPPAAVAHYGKDELILTADSVVRTAEREFDVTGGSFTPCQCEQSAAPSWRIASASASVDLDSGAFLTWPVFYIKELPVFVLPAFYVPLGRRRSGVLFPRIGASSATGFSVTQPLYLTFGRSWDATVNATYHLSRGPAPGLELRWAPSRRSAGQLNATVIADFGVLDPESRTWSARGDDPIIRYLVTGEHRTRWDRSQLAIELNLLGDPNFPEFADEFLDRQVETSVSRATYTAISPGAVRVATGVAMRQDLRAFRYISSEYPANADRRSLRLLAGDPGSGDVRYRFAELRLDAPPHPLVDSGLLIGEATFSGQAFASPFPEQPRFARADMRPSVRAPLNVMNRAVLEPSVAMRFGAWSGRSGSESINETRVALVARTTLFTELSRRYGQYRHRIRPELRHAIIPLVEGDGPGVFDTADEVDQLGRAHQVAARLVTDLWGVGQGRRIAGLAATLGRDLGIGGVAGEGTSPLVLEGDLDLRFADGLVRTHLSAVTAIEVVDPGLSELIAQASLRVGSWGGVSAIWADLDDDLPRRTFVAPEELVPSSTIDRTRYVDAAGFSAARGAAQSELRPISSGTLDVAPWTAYRGLTLTSSLNPVAPLALTFSMTVDVERAAEVSALRNIGGSLGWTSSCDCWGLVLNVSKARDRPAPDFRLLVDLARLGSVASPGR